MKSIVIPFPSKDIQQSIVDVVKERKQRAKQLQMEGTAMFEKAKQEIERLILG
jgi:type I restriction enzyme S subunit